MWLSLLPFIIAATASEAVECTECPTCRYLSDDPVCHAVCAPVCAPAQCEVCQLTDNSTPVNCLDASQYCRVQCPSPGAAIDECPQCETQCEPLCGSSDNCIIVCEAPDCGWRCQKPRNCPKPICELQCEAPACEASGTSVTVPLISLAFVLFVLQQQH